MAFIISNRWKECCKLDSFSLKKYLAPEKLTCERKLRIIRVCWASFLCTRKKISIACLQTLHCYCLRCILLCIPPFFYGFGTFPREQGVKRAQRQKPPAIFCSIKEYPSLELRIACFFLFFFKSLIWKTFFSEISGINSKDTAYVFQRLRNVSNELLHMRTSHTGKKIREANLSSDIE